MLSPLIAAMFGAAATFNYTLPPAQPVGRKNRCDEVCTKRYRIAAASDDFVSLKSRALADDGTKCNVVGAKLCTTQPRRLWRSRFGN